MFEAWSAEENEREIERERETNEGGGDGDGGLFLRPIVESLFLSLSSSSANCRPCVSRRREKGRTERSPRALTKAAHG